VLLITWRHSKTRYAPLSAITQGGLRPILEAVMPRWYECANEASFKSAPGGHVFQAPSPWMLAWPRYYLVNDAQKAALLAGLGRWRLLLMIATVIELVLALSVALPVILWPSTFARLFLPMHQQLGTGLFATVLAAIMLLPIVSLFAVPQIYLARVLRSVLADAPRSEERITVAEQLSKIAASVSGKVLVVGLLAGLAITSSGILLMADAFLDGHLARSAPPNAALFIAGGLLTCYFVYLLRLKAKSKQTQTA
jgi:hypothetical protein